MDHGLAPCHIHCCLSRLPVCDRVQSCPLRVARRPACHLWQLVCVSLTQGSPRLLSQETQSHDSMVASPNGLADPRPALCVQAHAQTETRLLAASGSDYTQPMAINDP